MVPKTILYRNIQNLAIPLLVMHKSVQYPTEVQKIVVKYPKELHGACPLCESPVKRKYNSSKKTIYCLKQSYQVRYDLMICTNENCRLHDVPFNPSPRFDYSQRWFGKDVLAKIGEYSILSTTKLNSKQITELLHREYDLPIHDRTVSRMCDDILVLTSFQIDKNTQKILKDQKFLLVALDGQEPDGDRPALWNFSDLISGRVLMTRYLDRVDHKVLHECIEDLKQLYGKKIAGFVSDKQGAIRKCMETYYSDIPHQYCTYHFSTNLWNHLEKYGNKIHKTLTKTVKGLYIKTVSVNTQIKIPNQAQKTSLKKLCAPLAKEIQANLKNRNEKFKNLKGIEGFERLTEYTKGFQEAVDKIPYDDRFAKILKKAISKINQSLHEVKPLYDSAVEGFQFFQSIHKLLWKEGLAKNERVKGLNQLFESIWERVKELHPDYQKSARKSFSPSSKAPYWKILAEFTRLWESYRPGLFNYYEFPLPVRSNVDMEQKFSTETQRFRSQCGRGHVGQMIRSRGEYALRLQYCEAEEIDFDQIIGNSKGHLSYLREHLQSNITESCKPFKNHRTISNVYTQLLARMYGMKITKSEED